MNHNKKVGSLKNKEQAQIRRVTKAISLKDFVKKAVFELGVDN